MIRRVEDYSRVREALLSDPIENAFMLYDVEFEDRRYVEVHADEGGGLMLEWNRLEVPTVMVRAQSPGQVEAFLGLLPGGRRYNFIVPMWMAGIVKGACSQIEKSTFMLYRADDAGFRGVEDERAFRVTPDMAGEMAGQMVELWPHTSKEDFVRERIRDGIFYGIGAGGRLASFAGTLLETRQACALGFVYTREEHRGEGLGRAVVSAVSREILDGGRAPILYVVEGNQPAVRLYESLGYVKHVEHAFIEGTKK